MPPRPDIIVTCEDIVICEGDPIGPDDMGRVGPMLSMPTENVIRFRSPVAVDPWGGTNPITR